MASSIILENSAMTSKLIFLFHLSLSYFVSVVPFRLSVNNCVFRKKSPIGQQSPATRCSSTSELGRARGLLRGIFDVANVKDYSRRIILEDAVDLLKDTRHIYNIALVDANGNATECNNNLTEIVRKVDTFMHNKDEVLDRDELKGALKGIFADVGVFVCLLGGKHIGNSFVLRNLEKLSMDNLEKLHMETVLLVDLRAEGSDILEGLLSVLDDRRKYYVDMQKQESFEASRAIGSASAKCWARSEEYDQFASILSAILDNNDAKQSLPVLMSEILKKVEGKITLVIDSADIAFTIKYTTEQELEEQKHNLALFKSLTKKSRKV